MVTADRRINRKLAQIPSMGSFIGRYLSQEGALAAVTVGTETVRVPYVGQYPASPDDWVQLEWRNNRLVVIGPASPKVAAGRVTSPGTPLSTVVAGGVTYQLPYDPSYTPALNDDVSIDWFYPGGRISGKVSTTPVATVPAVVPTPAPTAGRQQFTALDSGSYGSGWWTADVYASSSNLGAWWRGAKVRNTIPDNATITAARIYLPARKADGADPILQLHNAETRTGGPPTFIGSGYALPERTGWVDIPLSFAEYLKTSVGDIGFNHGGYSIFRGIQSDRLSGALDIAWTT